MPTETTWQEWLERLYNLRRRGSHERPYKPALLLSALDLLDRGRVKTNEIALTPEFVKTLRRYFDLVRKEDDKPSIEDSFYILSRDGFWKVDKPVRAFGVSARRSTRESKARGALVSREGVRLRRRQPEGPTEVAASVKQRRGQDYFRDAVLNHFGGRCGRRGLSDSRQLGL